MNSTFRNIAAPLRCTGEIIAARGPLLFAKIPHAALGDLCEVALKNGSYVPAQVVGFQAEVISLAPLEYFDGVSPGAEVRNCGRAPELRLPENLLGSVVDALGTQLRSPPKEICETSTLTKREMCADIFTSPPPPLQRRPVDTQLVTGVKAIDALVPLGCGQRVCIISGAGAGKSTLLGMISRNAEVDVSIIALVGERGREVNEFIEHSLGGTGIRKAVVVVATSDESPLRRRMAAYTATAIAETFRSKGKRVLLLIDSLTRVARAIREVGLAAGELPVRQGLTPSVYSELPRLVERAGNDQYGSITAIYTVLSEHSSDHDPLCEELKSLVDGHIVLSQEIADMGIRPSIAVTESVTRVLHNICSSEDAAEISLFRRLLARLKRDRDVALFGGTPDAELSALLALEHEIIGFLNQQPAEQVSADAAKSMRTHVISRYRELLSLPAEVDRVANHGIRRVENS